jgi:hypothetical protein
MVPINPYSYSYKLEFQKICNVPLCRITSPIYVLALIPHLGIAEYLFGWRLEVLPVKNAAC